MLLAGEFAYKIKRPVNLGFLYWISPTAWQRGDAAARAAQGGDASDAGIRVLELQLSRTMPPGDDEAGAFLYVDAASLKAGAPDTLVNLLHDRLGLAADPLPRN